DVDQQRCHVDELSCDIHVELFQILDVSQILRGDFSDWNVIDIDVLLTDEIEQQVKRAVIDLADSDCEGEFTGWFALRFGLYVWHHAVSLTKNTIEINSKRRSFGQMSQDEPTLRSAGS